MLDPDDAFAICASVTVSATIVNCLPLAEVVFFYLEDDLQSTDVFLLSTILPATDAFVSFFSDNGDLIIV